MEQNELEHAVRMLWEKTVSARKATDKGLLGNGDDEMPSMNKESLVKLAEILEMHPELFEDGQLPDTPGGNMYNRSVQWQNIKAKKVQQMRNDLKVEELVPCKSTPTINNTSQSKVEKLLEAGSWPEVVTRMTIHHQAQMERKMKTEAWKAMHSVLSDTHSHVPTISSKASLLTRGQPVQDRLYALKDKPTKASLLTYPYGDPDSSWTQAELDAFAKDNPHKADLVKKVSPGGFLSPNSRHLSDTYAAKSGVSHKARLTTIKKQSTPQDVHTDVKLGKKTQKLAEEWRKTHTDPAEAAQWKRLSTPVPPPIQPPPMKGIPGINKTTSVETGALSARITRPVHERLFKDHDVHSKHKEELRHKNTEKIDTPRKKAYQQLKEHVQGYEAFSDVFNRNKQWASTVMVKRERARSEQREKEVAYPFKPTLTPYKSFTPGKQMKTPVDTQQSIRTPPTVPTEVDMEEHTEDNDATEGELFSSEKPNRVLRSVSPQPQRLFEEEVYIEHLPQGEAAEANHSKTAEDESKRDPSTLPNVTREDQSDLSNLHDMLTKYIEERAASLASVSSTSTQTEEARAASAASPPRESPDFQDNFRSPSPDIVIEMSSPLRRALDTEGLDMTAVNIIHAKEVVAAVVGSEDQQQGEKEEHVTNMPVAPKEQSILTPPPAPRERYNADYYDGPPGQHRARSAEKKHTPSHVDTHVRQAADYSNKSVDKPVKQNPPVPVPELISIVTREGLPTTPMRSVGGDGPLLNSVTASPLVKIESVRKETSIVKQSRNPVKYEPPPLQQQQQQQQQQYRATSLSTSPVRRSTPSTVPKPAVPKQVRRSASPAGRKMATYAEIGAVQHKVALHANKISPMTLRPWREPVRPTKKAVKRRVLPSDTMTQPDEFVPTDDLLFKEKQEAAKKIARKTKKDDTPVNECYVGKDGMVRLLKMGMRKNLPKAPKNADEKYKALQEHKKTEEIYNLTRVDPEAAAVVTTSLDLKGDSEGYCRLKDEEIEAVGKALLSLGAEKEQMKAKTPAKRVTVTIPMEFEGGLSDETGSEGYIIDPEKAKDLDELTKGHLPPEIELGMREGSVARTELNRFITLTHINTPPTDETNPVWNANTDPSYDSLEGASHTPLATLLENNEVSDHGCRTGLPFVLNIVSPVKKLN
eukprot:TRINITY_DN1056_c0_g1_i1.p1 TRINITY_DN1056_c0_g1~~TRINITY_DN1056_c0_g1_i1.p1  ORF type:complete len:1169 (+),score=279.24 TRINITY_DN1056_c0_g1_i1:52-3507(+)